MNRGRVYIRTLGCPKNEADGAALTRHLKLAGWTVVDDPECADAEIVNTCGFIEPTKLESLEAIWEGVSRRDTDRSGRRRLVVTGCLAQRYAGDLAKEIPSVDAIVGFNRPDLVERALEANRTGPLPVCWVEKPDAIYREHTTTWQIDTESAPLSTYIKIGDGCDNACRFCAIPLIRGRLRSRPLQSIVEEVTMLVSNGTREVILVSQDTTSWGTDLDNGTDLALLLHHIDSIPGDFWVRLMYAHPAFVTERLIASVGDCTKLVPYLDMPMQHISDRMLTIMNRHTTKVDTQRTIDALRRVRPDLAMRTTFIVGHPGETEHDFAELLTFAEENGFERMGAFVYSTEDGTPSARMDDVVPRELASQRAGLLAEAFDRWSADQSVQKLGSFIPTLLEQRSEDGCWEGRTIHDAPDIDGRIIVSGDAITAFGIYNVLVTGAEGVDLTGRCDAQHDAASGRRPSATVGATV